MDLNRSRIFEGLKILLVVLLGLTPILWFINKGSVLINGVDTNFPLDPQIWIARRFFVWSDIQNGGSDFSSSASGLFFHFIQLIPYSLGFGLQISEIFSLVFWFLAIILSVFLLARALFKNNFWVQILFVCFYAFNIYLFNTWENVKVSNLALVASIPLGLWILDRMNKEQSFLKLGLLYSIPLGIILSGAGINPAYFICFYLVLFLFQIGAIIGDSKDKVTKKITNFLLLSIVIFLINSFWIFPTLNFILKTIPTSNSIGGVGFTDWVNSLSENTSLLNVLRLQGAWDWYSFDAVSGLPLYIPYALNYFYSLPFLAFSFLVTSLVILSLVFRDRKQNSLYISFTLMVILGVFLGAGTHSPTGFFFNFLMNKLPFLSLFRSPWYIFTPLVTLGFAGLVSLLFYNFKVEKWNIKNNGIIANFLVIALLGALLLYNYPLISGKIFRPNEHDKFFISFPQYVFDSKKYLDQANVSRILGYPDDEIEQFNFGYRGIESILQLLSNKETLFMPLNGSNSSLALIIKEFYSDLKKNQSVSFYNLASKLNADTLFIKKDQQSLSPTLSKQTENLPLNKFGPWEFYTLSNQKNLAKIYSPQQIYLSFPYDKSYKAMKILDSKTDIINPNDNVVIKNPGLYADASSVIIATNSQRQILDDYFKTADFSNHLVNHDLTSVDFNFTVPQSGNFQVALEKDKLEAFGIDVTNLLNVKLDSQDIVLETDSIDDSFVFFKEFSFNRGNHTITFKLSNNDLIKNGNFDLGIPKNIIGETSNFSLINDSGTNNLSIFNQTRKEIGTELDVENFDPSIPYYIQFRYRKIYGTKAQIRVTQEKGSTAFKIQPEVLPDYPEWIKAGFFFEPVRTDSTIRLVLLASFTKDPLGTKVSYDDVSMRKVFTNDLMLISKPKSIFSPQVTYKQLSPVLYEGEVKGAVDSHLISFLENYSNDWKITLFDEQDKKLDSDPAHLTTNFYGNGWYIKGSPASYKFRIYYQAQNLFYGGVLVSTLTLLWVLFLNIKSFFKKHR